jgi:hypothetical protein
MTVRKVMLSLYTPRGCREEWSNSSAYAHCQVDGGEWLALVAGRFIPGEESPDSHSTGGR